MPEWLEIAYWANALAIGLTAGICTVRYRNEIRGADGAYLYYWIAACASWVVFYLLKALGRLPSPDFSATDFSIEPSYGAEFLLNYFNSLCVLMASACFRKGPRQGLKTVLARIGSMALIASAIVLLFTLVWIGIAGSMGDGVDSEEARGWATVLMLAGSFVGGAVLILFYHRLSLHRAISPNRSAILLGVFFWYAYMQAWYPYVSSPGAHEIKGIIATFFVAAVLKVACTILAFVHSRTPLREVYAE